MQCHGWFGKKSLVSGARIGTLEGKASLRYDLRALAPRAVRIEFLANWWNKRRVSRNYILRGWSKRFRYEARALLHKSELELVRRAVGGDEAAFGEIIDLYANDLYKLAYSLTGNFADVEDVVQETFIGAFKGLRRFEGRSALKTWLVSILVRQVARHRRYRRVRRTFSLHRTEEDSAFSLGKLQAGAVWHDPDIKLDLHTMLNTLSSEHRAVVVLRELEGMSYREMAEALKVPVGTVESRLFRARDEIRRRFRGYFSAKTDANTAEALKGRKGTDRP